MGSDHAKPVAIGTSSTALPPKLVTRIREQNAVFCSRLLSPVNRAVSLFSAGHMTNSGMANSLFDRNGNRKYLVARERLAFVRSANAIGGEIGVFCLTLAFTGARISEVLALVVDRIDTADEAIIFRTLKQRRKMVFRAVPVPISLIAKLVTCAAGADTQIFPWGRTTAWKIVKDVMRDAGIADRLSMPKALRHAFAIEAGQNGVPLNIVQRWLGHARIETTAIYAGALGEEERALARRSWQEIEKLLG